MKVLYRPEPKTPKPDPHQCQLPPIVLTDDWTNYPVGTILECECGQIWEHGIDEAWWYNYSAHAWLPWSKRKMRKYRGEPGWWKRHFGPFGPEIEMYPK